MSILEHVQATWFLARITSEREEGTFSRFQIQTVIKSHYSIHLNGKADCMKTDSLRVNMTHLNQDRICGEIFCTAIMMALLTWYSDMNSSHWMLIPSFHIRET